MVDETSTVRIIDRFVDVTRVEVMGFTWAGDKETGRPAYPAYAFVKLYVYGYLNGIRSSRKLEQETHRNVEVMWLMNGLTPDHKAISEFRRINVKPLKALFKSFVKLCRRWDLVGDEMFAIDGTTIRANNNSYKNFNLKKVTNKLKELDEKIQKYLDDMDAADREEHLDRLNKSRAKYEEVMRRLEQEGDRCLSLTDPDAPLVCDKKGGLMPGYNVQSVVDSKHDIVVEIDTNQSAGDNGLLSVMVEKTQESSANKAFLAVADKGYWKGDELAAVETLGAIPLVSEPKNPQRTDQPDAYKTDKFHYDSETDEYICPQGAHLVCHHVYGKQAPRHYKRYFDKEVCSACPCQPECCKCAKLGFKTINRSPFADAIERNTERLKNDKAIYRRRKELVEHPFGTVKRTMNGGYYLLRTLSKVSAETALMFLGYNIRRVVNVLGFEKMMRKLAAV
jgi:transposase